MALTENRTPAASPASPAAPAAAERLERAAALLRRGIFFIVGCQKSGTTWLQRLLDAHSAICCKGETCIAPLLVPALRHTATIYNENQKAGEGGGLDEAAQRTLCAAATALVFDRWVGPAPLDRIACIGEKTPEHALCLDVLDEIFPAMRVIHVLRDGRDVAVSGWFHNLRREGDAFWERFPDLPAYIEHVVPAHWLPYIAAARAFGRRHPGRFHEVRYEDLHAEPRRVMTDALGFLGVDASGTEVDRCLEAGSFRAMSGGRAAGEEDRSSFFRKGVVGDWREHFDRRATDAFMEHGGDLLRELGYDAQAGAAPAAGHASRIS